MTSPQLQVAQLCCRPAAFAAADAAAHPAVHYCSVQQHSEPRLWDSFFADARPAVKWCSVLLHCKRVPQDTLPAEACRQPDVHPLPLAQVHGHGAIGRTAKNCRQ
eukprot:CAMPEP_0172719362 /NCGR_PEP_ID=MMETSP1074-20121228/75459_1 /TAXON_ID=2916 /ORGANISM="Ceratium fusus, Strain PA161109" /LENGTH=104 /DNA_ID=CAMNT_0013544703 /DNA_START=613 /DNA_END=927 /DNA_ORIENTATION=-